MMKKPTIAGLQEEIEALREAQRATVTLWTERCTEAEHRAKVAETRQQAALYALVLAQAAHADMSRTIRRLENGDWTAVAK